MKFDFFKKNGYNYYRNKVKEFLKGVINDTRRSDTNTIYKRCTREKTAFCPFCGADMRGDKQDD